MTLPLSPLDQARLTVALELDDGGFPDAAQWLRSRVAALKTLEWDEVAARRDGEIAHAHRGSLPPVAPAPQPMSHTPAPRPDQPIAL